MAKEKPAQNLGGRFGLLVALIALAVVSAVAFGRIFQGTGTSARLGLAAGMAVLLAGAVQRRPVLLAVVVSAAGLALAIGVLVFPETTKWGLPTGATLRATAAAFRAVSRTAAAEVAPAVPLPPLLLAGLTAVWTAGFAQHTLAVRARSPFLAVLPPAALLGFTSLIVGDGARPFYVLAFLLAALAVLFADALRRVGQWGPLVVWRARRRFRVGAPGAVRGARRVAGACLGVALFTPWLLPGFKSPGMVSVQGDTNPTRVSIDPIVDIRPRLLLNPPVQVFTVHSDYPSYWRFLALDRFTGHLWNASPPHTSAVTPGSNATAFLGDDSQVIDPAHLVHQSFQFDRLTQPWLPAAFQPVSFSGTDERVEFDPTSSLLLAPNGASRGFSYQLTSVAESPSPADLEALGNFAGSPGATRDTQLPSDLPEEIAGIAHRLSDGQSSTYRKVVAIQNYLLTFRYDDHVRAGHGSSDILNFLKKSRAGYCEQFAGTMAVLLRALGIPARVAVGFTPGSFDPVGQLYRVTTQNAHAWVEVRFPRYGWLAFEPTPGRVNPEASKYDFPPPAGGINGDGPRCLLGKGPDGCAGLGTGPVRPDPSPTSSSPSTSPPPRHIRPGGETGGQVKRGPGSGSRAVAGGVALAGIALIGVVAGKPARRRLMVARATEPKERVLAAYRAFALRAADLGLARRAPETLPEYGRRLVGRMAIELDVLTGLAGMAAYSELPPSAGQAREAVAAARRAARGLARGTTIATRVIGAFRVSRVPG